MHLIKDVIQTLQKTYQQPMEPIPNLPDCINLPGENSLVVLRIKNGYKVDNLQEKKSYIVSKVNGKVYCSCDHGQQTEHCTHKIEVLREAKKLQRMKVDECIKRRIGSNMSQYIHRLRQIVERYERNKDTQNSTYAYFKGKLAGLRLVLRIVIEA